jgi:hypothetical protein
MYLLEQQLRVFFELLMWSPGHGSGSYSLVCDRVLGQLVSRPVHIGFLVDNVAVREVLPNTSVSPVIFIDQCFIHIHSYFTYTNN